MVFVSRVLAGQNEARSVAGKRKKRLKSKIPLWIFDVNIFCKILALVSGFLNYLIENLYSTRRLK